MGLYSAILRNTVLPLLLRRERQLPSLRHFDFLMQSQYWPREKIESYQRQQLQALIEHAYEHTVYYRELMAGLGLKPADFRSLDDIRLLPPLTRDITLERRDDLISDRFPKHELQEFTTGGTTGKRAVLYRTPESFNIKLALTWRYETMMGCFPCDKIVYIWPAEMDFVPSRNWRMKFRERYLLRRIMHNTGAIDGRIFESVNKDLKRFAPAYYKVFPSALYSFAEYAQRHGAEVHRPEAIMSTGEPLYDFQETLLEEVYGCPIFDMYGSREVGNSACECEAHDGMHLAMETCLTEFVRDGQPVADGEEGEILITDFTNHGFPMIRYAINDYGIPDRTPCRCGRGATKMKKAIGRISDLLIRPDGSTVLGHILGIALTGEGPILGQVQVHQKTLTDFEVNITDTPPPTLEMLDYIDMVMRRHVAPEISLKINIVPEIPKERSGKVRYLKSDLAGAVMPETGR